MTPALPAGCVIALLGADGSGKTQLAEALAQRLAQRNIAATLAADPLPGHAFDAATLEAYRGCTLILLIAPASPTRIDEMLREALMNANLGFAVVHGEGAEQLTNAWNAINAAADPDARRGAGQGATAAWSWACDKCSDPACEHKLFSDLVARRS
jgi:energy-coupling factor transporter ATP-binding protein EcfA2